MYQSLWYKSWSPPPSLLCFRYLIFSSFVNDIYDP